MITIQQATTKDADLIAGIATRSFLESHGDSAPAADIESFVSRNYDLEPIEKELNDPENIFHIIYYKDQPAGYSKIIFNKPHPLTGSAAVTKLERIYLLKEFYDLKLGLALFEFIVSLSKQEKQEGIWLFVWIKNERAVNFYKKNGFKVIDHTEFKISATHSNPNYVMYLEY